MRGSVAVVRVPSTASERLGGELLESSDGVDVVRLHFPLAMREDEFAFWLKQAAPA